MRGNQKGHSRQRLQHLLQKRSTMQTLEAVVHGVLRFGELRAGTTLAGKHGKEPSSASPPRAPSTAAAAAGSMACLSRWLESTLSDQRPAELSGLQELTRRRGGEPGSLLEAELDDRDPTVAPRLARVLNLWRRRPRGSRLAERRRDGIGRSQIRRVVNTGTTKGSRRVAAQGSGNALGHRLDFLNDFT